MRSSHTLDRLDTAFDDDRLVADAGLLLPATLAQHLGLRDLVDEHVSLGAKPGAANPGDKLLTLVMSALAGGDTIDDAEALRSGGTGRVLGFRVKAASTLGTFLRSSAHDRSRLHDLRDIWPGEGGGPPPRLHRGPWRSPAARGRCGTGEVLMARLREGRANTARGAAHFLVETITRVRSAGASGQLTMRADSASTPTRSSRPAGRRMSASPSRSASTGACAA